VKKLKISQWLICGRKESDRDGLKERKEQASLYFGETARLISERAGEHWEDALGGKEESHRTDTEWDKRVWEEAWEPRAEPVVAEDSLRETGKA
jgi:hypothetical protein